MLEYYKTNEHGYLTVLGEMGCFWYETGSAAHGPWDFIVSVSKAAPYKTEPC